MPGRAALAIPSADLDVLLKKTIAQVPDSLTATRVRSALPPGYRIPLDQLKERLSALAKQGLLFEWPTRPKQYAARSFEAFVRERVIEVLQQPRALTGAEISKKLPTVARPFIAKTLKVLVEEGRVYRHPKIGRREPYGLAPPNPLDYLRPTLEKLLDNLRRVGFSLSAVREAFQQYLKCLPTDSEPDDQVILSAMQRLNPQAARGALVYIPELRQAVRDRFLDKISFDQTVLGLTEQGKVQLQSHDLPAQLSPEQREAMIDNSRGGYFMAIGIRME